MASCFAESPDYIQNLKTYLLELPSKAERCTDLVRNDLRRELFRAASNNGQFIELFFPDIHDSTLLKQAVGGDLDVEEWLTENRDSIEQVQWNPYDFSWNLESSSEGSKDDPYHPGRPCVRKFKRGEPTYRCQ